MPIHPSPTAISEGVGLIGANNLQARGFKGRGAKVAVIDLGFEGFQAAANRGELPSQWRFKDYTGDGFEAGTEHGTGVAEIVFDVAPEAELLAIRVGDLVDFENAKDLVLREGADIVNFSAAFFATGFGDGLGRACEIVNDAADKGILWVNSAGNYAKKQYSQLHTDLDSDGWHNIPQSGDDEVLGLTGVRKGDQIELWLVWNDWPITGEDYDLVLGRVGADGSVEVVAESRTTQVFSAPFEHVAYTVDRDGDYGFAVWKERSARSTLFRVISQNHEIEDEPSIRGTIAIPADADGAFAVAAVNYWNWSAPKPSEFSSRGPTFDGRIKPDLTGPNGVSNYSYPGGFFGTSAASPHVAGAAALVKGADPAGSDSEDLRNALIASTIDVGDSGKDNEFGWGLLDLSRLDLGSQAPIAVLLSSRVDFGAVSVGNFAKRSVAIHNSGTVTLEITDLVTAGTQFIATPDADPDVVLQSFDQPLPGAWWQAPTELQRGQSGRWLISGDDSGFYSELSNLVTYRSPVIASVETEWTSGTDNNSYGFLLHATNTGSYQILISANGFYFILKNNSGEFTTLQDWTAEPSIRQRGRNTLRVESSNSGFRFLINGTTVDQIADSEHTEGRIELVVAGVQTIAFDNFLIVSSGRSWPIQIGPGDTESLGVVFLPTEEAQSNGTLNLTTNDPNRETMVVQLSGSSSEGGSRPVVSLSRSSVSFDQNVSVGTVVSLDIVISNKGHEDLEISSILAPVPFAVSASRATLGPGRSFTVRVSYTPIAIGAHSGSLTIRSNDPERPEIVLPISGRAVQGQLLAEIGIEFSQGGGARDLQVDVGDTISVRIIGRRGIEGTRGYEVAIEYGTGILSALEIVPSGLYAGSLPLRTDSENGVKLAVALLGRGTVDSDAGELGDASFVAHTEGRTQITLTSAKIGTESGALIASVPGELRSLSLQVENSEKTPDFDGDGRVQFGDFLVFAVGFGSHSTTPGFNERLDLDSDGSIGFSDFLIFAAAFGQ